MPAETTSNADLASQILVLIGHDPRNGTRAAEPAAIFRACSREQLLDCARRLGLTGVGKLSKDALVARVQAAFEGLPRNGATHARAAKPAASGPSNGAEADAPALFPTKFDLGPDAEEEAAPENIPWGYGQDRVTAMFVDPDRLYAYWEATDAAIETCRRALGAGGAGAWLNLRVYDITGRLFDGTNAHGYFDHKIERHDRQWFFDINKPTSTACVELGLKSAEGYFVKIARSGRVEFPRRGPAGDGPVEWLTVRNASGPAGEAVAGGPPGGPGGGGAGESGGGSDNQWAGWTEGAGFPVPGGHRIFERRWEWQEGVHDQWSTETAKVEWVSPVQRTEWEEGPFSYPVEPPPLVEHRDSGEVSVRTQNGRVHVVYGPWQVVIRGVGAHAERRVLGTWEYKRTIAITGGVERGPTTWRRVAPGSSEWMAMGASERAWLGASELLYRGSSELYMMGASELRFGGGSETLYAGASEYRYRGASERLQRGASEWSYRGASERMMAGASERVAGGASEQRLGGASEAWPAAGQSRSNDDGPLPYPET